MSNYSGAKELSIKEKLLNKMVMNPKTDCWEWTAGTNNIGYGMMRDGDKMRTAHRLAYEEFKGIIPKGMQVLHICDNPKCINPKHLWLGTIQDNMRDKKEKGRSGRTGRPKGLKHKRKICEHCNADLPVNTYARFHGLKCKSLRSA